MPNVSHKGNLYDQDMLDTACLILQEMNDEATQKSFEITGRPSIVQFASKFREFHPETSIVERKVYFDAFLGNEMMSPQFDIETGEALGR